MFDRNLFLQSGPSHVHVETDIHEHRAPTDASVRLLREMEEAALSKLVGTLRLENNVLKATAFVFRDQLGRENFLVVRFLLNNEEERELRAVIPRTDDPQKMMAGIRDALAKELATALIERTFSETAPHLENLLRR